MYILDTTLRDGSYLVDFQFSLEDTYILCYYLDKAGIDFIEIGHGLGIGQNKEKPLPYPEEAYYEYAKKAITRAKWGVFFIPGIGDYKDIDKLVHYGGSFIRIGIEATDVSAGIEYAKYAKEKGLFVCLNLMKTYSISGKDLEIQLQLYGELNNYIDVVYIVDSSGGMVGKNIDEYLQALKKHFKNIGFHGHNNLDMANANSLYAIEHGVTFIDVSLGGLGRSAGNTIAESFVLLLNKLGITEQYDYKLLMELSENFISPLLKNIEKNKLSYISGFADFHSSSYSKIFKFAKMYNVEEMELIVETSKFNKINPSEELIKSNAMKIKSEYRSDANAFLHKIKMHDKIGNLEDLYKKVVSHARKFKKNSFINLIKAPSNRVSNLIHNDSELVFTSISYSSLEDLEFYTKEIPTDIDFLYVSTVSSEERNFLLKNVTNKIIFYNDDELKLYSIMNYLKQLFLPSEKITIAMFGNNALALRLQYEISFFNYLNIVDSNKPADVLVLFSEYDSIENIEHYKYILDTNVGLIDLNKLGPALNYKYNIYRVDIIDILAKFAFLDYTLNQKFKNAYFVKNGQVYVSGGLVGKKGDMVVDNALNPLLIHGRADGKGMIAYNEEI